MKPTLTLLATLLLAPPAICRPDLRPFRAHDMLMSQTQGGARGLACPGLIYSCAFSAMQMAISFWS